MIGLPQILVYIVFKWPWADIFLKICIFLTLSFSLCISEICRERETRRQHRNEYPSSVGVGRGRGQQRRHRVQPERALQLARPRVLRDPAGVGLDRAQEAARCKYWQVYLHLLPSRGECRGVTVRMSEISGDRWRATSRGSAARRQMARGQPAIGTTGIAASFLISAAHLFELLWSIWIKLHWLISFTCIVIILSFLCTAHLAYILCTFVILTNFFIVISIIVSLFHTCTIFQRASLIKWSRH